MKQSYIIKQNIYEQEMEQLKSDQTKLLEFIQQTNDQKESGTPIVHLPSEDKEQLQILSGSSIPEAHDIQMDNQYSMQQLLDYQEQI